MLIYGLMQLLYWFLSVLLFPIHIPSLPSGIDTVLDSVLDYIDQGLDILAAFTHFSYISSLFVASLGIYAAMLIYKFIIWLLKKIPAAGIE